MITRNLRVVGTDIKLCVSDEDDMILMVNEDHRDNLWSGKKLSEIEINEKLEPTNGFFIHNLG